MKRLLALVFSALTALAVLLVPSTSAGAQPSVISLVTANPANTGVAPPMEFAAAMLGNCSAPGVCGRIKNGDGEDRFRITFAWGGDGSSDMDLYPGQLSWNYGPDADGFRIGRCWRAHLWKVDPGTSAQPLDYGYKYGPPASSTAGWTWFKVTDNIGPCCTHYWLVNGLVRVC